MMKLQRCCTCVFGLILLGLTACAPPQPPDPPPRRATEATLTALLADSGRFEKPEVEEIIGRRFLPGTAEWQVIACFSHGTEEARRLSCEDGFRIFPLDSGVWIGSLRIESIYRWRSFDSATRKSSPS